VTDSTHVKANASRSSEDKVDVQEEAGNYWERLDAYEEEGLEELKRRTGKRCGRRTKQVKKDNRRTQKRVSRTDPEAGYMTRPGKSNGFYYLSHQTTDPDCGIITAYDLPLAHRVPEELGIDFFVVPQPAHDRTKAELKRDVFSYDKQKDIYICPSGKELRPKRLYRSDSGLSWEYWANRTDCARCPLRDQCLSETDRAGARKLQAAISSPRFIGISPDAGSQSIWRC